MAGSIANQIIRLLLGAVLMAVPHVADAEACWPDRVDPSISGQLLHYDYGYGGGTGGRPVMHAAMGRSRHGGHVWCGFMGTPDDVSHIIQVWETDARGVKVVWRNPPEWLTLRNFGAERTLSIYEKACARGTGPCYITERPGRGYRTTEYERSCEMRDGQAWYVTRSTGMRQYLRVAVDGVQTERAIVPSYSMANARWQRFDSMGRTVEDINYYWYDSAPGIDPPAALPRDRVFRLARVGLISDLPCLTGDADCMDDLADRPDESLNALYLCRRYADQAVVPDDASAGD